MPQTTPRHHHFYRWYKLTIPSHGWFMTWIIDRLMMVNTKSSQIVYG
jgi:hypothetical protein